MECLFLYKEYGGESMEEKKNVINVAEIFGENVFNDTVMQERLPKKIYKELRRTIEEGKELDIATADVIAHEMKEWAIEKGATHYTHWFQPLTGGDGGKARFLYFCSDAEWKSADELFRKRADQGRTGRIFIPVRRASGYI